MTSDAEKRREYWREKNKARRDYMRQYRQRRKSAECVTGDESVTVIESLGTITAESAQEQDAAFRAAMSAAIASGQECAPTSVSTTPDTKAPIYITVNRYRIVCK